MSVRDMSEQMSEQEMCIFGALCSLNETVRLVQRMRGRRMVWCLHVFRWYPAVFGVWTSASVR